MTGKASEQPCGARGASNQDRLHVDAGKAAVSPLRVKGSTRLHIASASLDGERDSRGGGNARLRRLIRPMRGVAFPSLPSDQMKEIRRPGTTSIGIRARSGVFLLHLVRERGAWFGRAPVRRREPVRGRSRATAGRCATRTASEGLHIRNTDGLIIV